MDDQEFLRRLRKYARAKGGSMTVIANRGKGSHRKVELELYGTVRHTILPKPKGELPKGTLSDILKQLGVPFNDF